MALLVPNVGEAIILNYLTNKDAPEDLVMRLYTNNLTPAETDVVGDYTEVSGSGYAAKTPGSGDWTVTPGAPSNAALAQQTFAFNADLAEDVYGYYFVRATSGELVWSERFTDGPYAINNNGDEIRITPVMTLD